LGDYQRALAVYEALENSNSVPEDNAVNEACCYFFLGMYLRVEKVSRIRILTVRLQTQVAPKTANRPHRVLQVLEKAPNDSKLKTRIQFHLSHKLGDETRLMEYHKLLADVTEDQLSLASIHYLRAHYQEAIDIYKRILLDNKCDYNILMRMVAQLPCSTLIKEFMFN
jgi:intraflagellar transport protein 56